MNDNMKQLVDIDALKPTRGTRSRSRKSRRRR